MEKDKKNYLDWLLVAVVGIVLLLLVLFGTTVNTKPELSNGVVAELDGGTKMYRVIDKDTEITCYAIVRPNDSSIFCSKIKENR